MSYTAKDLDTLRRQAQQIQQVLAARRAADRQRYTARQTALDTGKENALRQAYISQQQALTQLPGQLKNAGINGGAAESSIVRLARSYGSARGDILAGYNTDTASLQSEAAASEAEHDAAAAQDRIAYLGAQSALQARADAAAAAAAANAAKKKTAAGKTPAAEDAAEKKNAKKGSGRRSMENLIQLVR